MFLFPRRGSRRVAIQSLVLLFFAATAFEASAQQRPLPPSIPFSTTRLLPQVRKVEHADYYAYVPPIARVGATPTICYFHGSFAEFSIPMSPVHFVELEDTFWHWANMGYLVIVPRWQGSMFPANAADFFPWAASWQDEAEATTLAALARFNVIVDRNRFALAGHSLGAMIALKMAHDRPAGVPTAKAVVLHDPSGFGFAPFVWPSGAGPMAGEFSHTWNDFSQIDRNTTLLCLAATDTYLDALDEEPRSQYFFGNHMAGGALSRVHHYIPSRNLRSKSILCVLDNDRAGVSSDHLGIYRMGIREVYWKYSDAAIAAAFAGQVYSPMPSGEYFARSGDVIRLPIPLLFPIPTPQPPNLARALADLVELAGENGVDTSP